MSDLEERHSLVQTYGIAGGDQENLQLQLWDHWEVLLAPAIPEIQPNQS